MMDTLCVVHTVCVLNSCCVVDDKQENQKIEKSSSLDNEAMAMLHTEFERHTNDLFPIQDVAQFPISSTWTYFWLICESVCIFTLRVIVQSGKI